MSSFKSLVSFFALASITAVSVAACSSAPDSSDDPTGTVQDQELRKSITSCDVDDDCVAVNRGGCCSNGWLEAVNKHHTKAYANQTACTTAHPICPLYVVHDTRVAQCDTSVKQCKMVSPDDVDTDAGPAATDAGPNDCRANGCSSGKYCSMCWGSYACIPNGALC